MTEKEFMQQIWRAYDLVTIEGVGKVRVQNVCFSTRSVRIKMPDGQPEWMRCEMIESHTTQTGGDADDASIIEELHNKLMSANSQITRLQEEKRVLTEKIEKNYLKSILTAVISIKDGIIEKKKKIEKVEKALEKLSDALAKIETEEMT